MIDTKELRRLAQAAMAAPDGLSVEWMDRLGQFQEAADASVVSELLDRLEAAESEALEEARLNGMGSEREAALLAKLEAAKKDRANFLVEMGRLCAQCDALRAKIETAENDAAHQKALAASALRVAEGWEGKCGELRAKVAEMGRQEPLDADSDVFRSAFEAALKAGNWPATRQGDGYRSPSTQIAWRIAFSTVNRLKLYLAPGAKGEEK